MPTLITEELIIVGMKDMTTKLRNKMLSSDLIKLYDFVKKEVD